MSKCLCSHSQLLCLFIPSLFLSTKMSILFKSNCILDTLIESRGGKNPKQAIWFHFKLISVNFKFTCPSFIPSLLQISLFSPTLNTPHHSYVLFHWRNVNDQKGTSPSSPTHVSELSEAVHTPWLLSLHSVWTLGAPTVTNPPIYALHLLSSGMFAFII